jgi:heme oxygenase
MTLIEQIRHETSELHSRLVHNKLTKRFISDEVTDKDYFKYIESFYALHHLVEPIIYPKAANFFSGIERNARLSMLERDVARFNGSKIAMNLSLESKHFSNYNVLGALYVLEGSRLGGRFIAKHLRTKLAPYGVKEFHFLEETPAVGWKAILELLSTREQNEAPEIIDSAKYMFKFVEELLEKSYQVLNEEN